jgi:MFS transporter, DHA2 family, multidrug resistance protein
MSQIAASFDSAPALAGSLSPARAAAPARVVPAARAASPAQTAGKASLRAWIAVLASMIGAFMAILNIQITNASLLDIEGGIGTGIDNGAWISTSYLIGEIVVIPLTDYLSRVFSFRRYILVNGILFPLFSIACAFTHDLGSMIAMRGLQGFAGGVLIPMAFTMVLTKLPKAQQPIGLALFAVSVTFAPAIGPTIGGYLTETYGWQTIFFTNVLPSLVMVAALAATLERQPMQLGLLKEGDWAGIVTMAIGLSALQTVLEEGNKDDWFGSPFIVRLVILAVLALGAFIAIELTAKKPLVQLRLLTRRNFGIGVLANVLVGFALFGSVYLLPQYLGQVQRYNAEQIGEVLAWTGLPQLAVIPLVPMLMKRLDVRGIAATGIAIFAFSMFMNVALSLDIAGDQFLIPNIIRALGQALVLTPISTITTAGIAPSEAGAASGLSNMLRNLGGAIGTATLQTIITKREQFHSNIIGHAVTLGSEATRDRIAVFARYFQSHGVADPAAAQHQAIVALGQTVHRQALAMGFGDAFGAIGVMLALAAIAVLFARKVAVGAGGAGAH